MGTRVEMSPERDGVSDFCAEATFGSPVSTYGAQKELLSVGSAIAAQVTCDILMLLEAARD